MAGLQRSQLSFRRQGSSGLVWDDKFLSELNQIKPEEQEAETKQVSNPEKIDGVRPTKNLKPIDTVERSRSNGERRGYRTGKVSPAIDPPSPKVSGCGFCSAFGKQQSKNPGKKPGNIRSR